MMKKWICLLLVVVTLCCCLTACGNKEGKAGYDACVDYLKGVLYVPSSLIIYQAESFTTDEHDAIYYCINYDAKNKLGTYSGPEDVYFSYEKETGKVVMYDTNNITSIPIKYTYDSFWELYVTDAETEYKIEYHSYVSE